MVMNTHGKPRLAKFYEYLWKSSRSLHEAFLRVPISYQHSSSSSSSSYFSFLCCRAENVSNFIEAESIFGPDSRLLYKHFATLDFVVVYSSEIELAVLDLIQGSGFKRYLMAGKASCLEYAILDEIIFGGQVLETSSTKVRLEAASNAITLIPKSASGWRSR
ncbi:AP complex [Theobroma cacao]|nr:AP complex [Theobroma cacao]